MTNTGRFYYRREHDHELGWSVVDSTDQTVWANGDKNICACVASLLNGEQYDGILTNLARLSDLQHGRKTA